MSVELGGHAPGWRRSPRRAAAPRARGERAANHIDLRIASIAAACLAAVALTSVVFVVTSRAFAPPAAIAVGTIAAAAALLTVLRLARELGQPSMTSETVARGR